MTIQPGYWARVGGGGALKGLGHNLLMQFFTLDSSKMGQVLMQFMHFSAIFAMAVLATLVTPWYPL